MISQWQSVRETVSGKTLYIRHFVKNDATSHVINISFIEISKILKKSLNSIFLIYVKTYQNVAQAKRNKNNDK